MPIKGGIFGGEKFIYPFFQISADLAGYGPKIDILDPKSWFLGIFASKNTKISIFQKMLPYMSRYQKLVLNHFRTPQMLILDHISSYNVI